MNWKLIHQAIEDHDATDVVETMEHVSFNVRIELNSEEFAAFANATDTFDADITVVKTGDVDSNGYTPLNVTLAHKSSVDWEDWQTFLRKMGK